MGERTACSDSTTGRREHGEGSAVASARAETGRFALRRCPSVCACSNHHGEELGEIDGAVAIRIDLVDHVLLKYEAEQETDRMSKADRAATGGASRGCCCDGDSNRALL